jgi:hypothetical protein
MLDHNTGAQRTKQQRPSVVTPKVLEFELGIDRRVIRAVLRQRFPRPEYGYWYLTGEQIRYLRTVLGAKRR